MTAMEIYIVALPTVGFAIVAGTTVLIGRFFVYRHAERTAREIARVYAARKDAR